MAKSIFALEQLEVDKLKEAKDLAAKSSEYAILYDNLKQKDTLELDKSKEDDVDDTETSEEPSSDESATEEPVEENTEDPSLESLREGMKGLTYSPEAFSDYLPNPGEMGKQTFGAVVAGIAAALVTLGIVYGPTIIKNVFKGVLYVFSKLAKLLYSSTVTLTKYIERRINSFNNLKEKIKSLKDAISLLKQKELKELDELKYTNERVINSLKIGNSVDIVANIKVLSKFVSRIILDIDKQINNDIGAIRHLIAYHHMGSKPPDDILLVRPINRDLIPGTVKGYSNTSDFTETYKYNEALPSDVALMAALPKQDLTSFEAISKAYSESSLFLGLDLLKFQEINNIDYMTLDDLNGLLTELEKLCDICIAHQVMYERIRQAKTSFKYSFKNYFLSIVNAPVKVKLKHSLVEYVYLKSMFIDKVYLVAAMDVHDYCAKTIVNGLSYIEDNIKKLS
jgi:hypothetical protein